MKWEWPGIRATISELPALTGTATVNVTPPPLPDPIALGDRLRCLTCAAPGPFASCVVLRSYVMRDGKLISEATHERVCCQRCGAQFTIGPEGAFHHHAAAQPYTGDAMPQQQPQMQTEPQEQRPATPPRPEWPTALPKPRV